MRTLEGSNRVRNGLLGIVVLLLALGVGQSFSSVPMLFATPTYYAQVSDTGGINTGDKVRIAGVDVGRVRSMNIDGDKVVIGYSLGGTQIGTASRAAIRTDTILGRRNIEIEPRGTKPLRANGILPLGQTTTPYQIYDAFFDVTKAASGWDTQTVKRSLNVLSETIDQTYPHLSAALDGVARFSDTIGKRDDQVKQLLANANKIAGVLGNRSEQVDSAFKKRGIDPEKFWGDAGLPAWRFPDPNGQRFPNGAPAPGPTPLEGTPEHPGPAVLKGSPCSYTPPPDGLPRPGNPLPCADLTTGPFGGPEFGPPDVVTSNPNPNGPGFTPGVPAAAIPGQMPPDMPGAPVPLPPAPPGARTVPLGPLPGPPDFTPGIAPLPPALTGPPPPPGPGPDAGPAGTPPLSGNPPYLPPGSWGG